VVRPRDRHTAQHGNKTKGAKGRNAARSTNSGRATS
jgi:hypothetical protein